MTLIIAAFRGKQQKKNFENKFSVSSVLYAILYQISPGARVFAFVPLYFATLIMLGTLGLRAYETLFDGVFDTGERAQCFNCQPYPLFLYFLYSVQSTSAMPS